ncbi:hypothetical protein Acsp03_23130 [Actinomadura sp. NBRC 104412]|uniref:DUF6924 domain-containing protein n=1 Tax=Actinomadura sp. NBRC 104412 TaxID=3032203 RepID=UPI0024A4A995|nr:hypothetical protein [Actinomadura sp. NBRC 104412]GLZ04847.1 hypothetical protein Acsp03_23130 [Actinomadura sp. NBRC 104412]
MSFPELPKPAPGEVLLVCTCYEDRTALWGRLLGEIEGRREGDVLHVEGGRVRLRVLEGHGWHGLLGGHVPALVPPGSPAPLMVLLADIPVVYGGDAPLLVDLAQILGRGVRVPSARLGEVLGALLDGALTFDHLVGDMDVTGIYQGDGGRPAFLATTTPSRWTFPSLPSPAGPLLVRTSFDDEEGWVGRNMDLDEIDVQRFPLTALVVDDRAFEDLRPGQVPTLVALADARTFAEPGRPLTVVDLWDTPGQPAVLPCGMVGLMACNLEIGNMDFRDFVPEKDVKPWWEDS